MAKRPNQIDGEWRWSFARRQFIPDHSQPNRTYLKRWRFDTPLGSVFVHAIQLPDGDPDPHNHPFSKSVSLILKGGYTELRGVHGEESRTMKAGRLNRIAGDDVHRIVALHRDKPVWTLFWAGKPHGRGWGFYVNGTFVDHKEYLAAKEPDRGAAVAS